MKQLFCVDAVRVSLTGLVLALGAGSALAALGQKLSASVSPSGGVQARAFASVAVLRSPLYTSHISQLESGTSVVEYANGDGLVFAISWRGPLLPDLGSLMGEYFAQFKAETEQARALGKRGSPAAVQSSRLVVRSGGRMRDFSGHAYAPGLIPAGVNINDVLR